MIKPKAIYAEYSKAIGIKESSGDKGVK